MKNHTSWKIRAKDLAWFDCGMDRRAATKYARKAYKSGQMTEGFWWNDAGLQYCPDQKQQEAAIRERLAMIAAWGN